MSRSVLITGAAGGIGAALMSAFSNAGWRVIGADRTGTESGDLIKADLAQFSSNADALEAFANAVRAASKDAPLAAIVNNAAVQRLGPLRALGAADIVETMNVNLIAPMLIVKAFLPELETARGSVVNIGSVHAEATKPEFSAYATSKAALHGLTRALAVDLGPAVRVNTLAPAATATDMLRAGFAGNEAAFNALEDAHPLKRIAAPEEIARLAVFLASDEAAFLTGAALYADGGVLSRLHDPV